MAFNLKAIFVNRIACQLSGIHSPSFSGPVQLYKVESQDKRGTRRTTNSKGSNMRKSWNYLSLGRIGYL